MDDVVLTCSPQRNPQAPEAVYHVQNLKSSKPPGEPGERGTTRRLVWSWDRADNARSVWGLTKAQPRARVHCGCSRSCFLTYLLCRSLAPKDQGLGASRPVGVICRGITVLPAVRYLYNCLLTESMLKIALAQAPLTHLVSDTPLAAASTISPSSRLVTGTENKQQFWYIFWHIVSSYLF